MNKIVLLLCILIFLNDQAFTQDSKWKMIYRYDPGLVNKNTLAIDSSNCKWIGNSINGIVKYDGIGKTIFNSSNTLDLKTNKILCIEVNRFNQKFIGTEDAGFFIFDGIDKWSQYTPTNSGLPGVKINSITFDEFGFVWLGTNKGLAKFKDSTISIYNKSYLNPYKFYDYNQIKCSFIDSKGNYWVGASFDYGISLLINDTLKIIDTLIQNPYSIKEDKQGYIWIAADNGLFKIEKSDILKIEKFNKDNFPIPRNNVYSVNIDKANTLFLGTNYDPNSGGWGIVSFDGINYNHYDQNTCPFLKTTYSYFSEIEIDKYNNKWFVGDPKIWVFNENGIDTTTLFVSVSENGKNPSDQISIYPNPIIDKMSISFSNTDFSELYFSIFNLLGTEIKRFDESELLGKSSISFSTEELPSGVYYCTMNNGTNTITKSFVVVR